MHPTSPRTRLLAAFLAGIIVTASVNWAAHWWRDRQLDSLGGNHAKAPVSREARSDRAAVELLRQGGLLIYIRHGNRQKWDSVIAFDIHEAASGEDAAKAGYRDAVCLSAQGRQEGLMIGHIFKMAGIPVGHVAASPICRARQTAELAFGRIDGIHAALIHTPVVNEENAAAFKQGLRKVLTTIPIAPGANTVISAHENTIVNHQDLFASGSEWFQGGMVSETGMYIIRRDADGKLHVVHKFGGLGDVAAAGITLRPEPAPRH